MSNMDMKGISWVGNMYHKFESMCMEVEENMYEDTVKYVEGQVRTVGACVKKFYSDVVEDLLPPSPTDTSKVDIHNCADALVYDKPKVEKKKEIVKVVLKQPSNESLVGTPVKKSHVIKSPSANNTVDNLSKRLSSSTLQIECSDYLEQYVNGNDGFRNKCFPSKQSRQDTSEGKDSSDPHSESRAKTSETRDLCEPDRGQHDESYKVICNHRNGGTLSSSAVTGNSGERNESETKDATDVSGSAVADGVGPILFSLTMKDELEENCSRESRIPLSGESTAESDAVSIVRVSKVDTEPLKNRMKQTCGVGSEDIFRKGIRFDDSANGVIARQNDQLKLEESLVIINKHDESLVLQNQRIHKSYKKKIRDVFYAKKWSKSMPEQRTYWCDEESEKRFADLNSRVPQSSEESFLSDSGETEWELV